MFLLFNKQKIIFILMISMSLMLSACTIATDESVIPTIFGDPVELSVESVQNSQKGEQVSEMDDPTPPVIIVDDTVEEEEILAEAGANVVEPPAIKTGLEATNPSTVTLASGEIQFVELFAFW